MRLHCGEARIEIVPRDDRAGVAQCREHRLLLRDAVFQALGNAGFGNQQDAKGEYLMGRAGHRRRRLPCHSNFGGRYTFADHAPEPSRQQRTLDLLQRRQESIRSNAECNLVGYAVDASVQDAPSPARRLCPLGRGPSRHRVFLRA
ncbi:MAG: hypothetical protein ACRYHA_13880 [Janthinobacterium lividum]